jgi:hypothetical protein
MATFSFRLQKRANRESVAVEITDQFNHGDEEHINTYSHRWKGWNLLPTGFQPTDLERRWDWTLVVAQRASGPNKVSIWVLRPTDAMRAILPTLGVIILQESVSPADGTPITLVTLIGVHPKCRSMGYGFLRRSGVVKGVVLALLKFASKRAMTIRGSGLIGLDAVGRSKSLYERIGLMRTPKGDKRDGTRYFQGVVK